MREFRSVCHLDKKITKKKKIFFFLFVLFARFDDDIDKVSANEFPTSSMGDYNNKLPYTYVYVHLDRWWQAIHASHSTLVCTLKAIHYSLHVKLDEWQSFSFAFIVYGL